MQIDLPHPLAGTVPQVGSAAAVLGARRSRTTARRRCSASTRRQVLRERLALADAAIADARGARRDRGARGRRVTGVTRAVARLTRRPAFWIAYAVARAGRARRRRGSSSRSRFRSSTSTSRSRATRRWRSAATIATRAATSRPTARAAPRASRTTSATQNYVELEGGGKPAFARAGRRASVYAPYWWEVRLFTPGEVDEAIVRFRPDGAPNGFARRCRRRTCATRRRKALDRGSRARARRRAGAQRTGSVDFAPYRAARAVAAARGPAGRVDHTLRLRARASSSATRASGCGSTVAGDELTEHRAVTCTCRSRSRAASRSCAARTTRSPTSPASPPGCSTGSAAASSACCGCARALAASWRPALGRGARRRRPARRRRRWPRRRPRGSASTPRSRSTTFWAQQVGAALLIAFGGGARVRARVHGGGEPVAARVPASSAAVARVVARRGADARGARPHARRLPVRAARAGARRGVLLRDQPLARLVAAVRGR